MGQKFTRNRSISYSFRDIFTVLFSTKIHDGCQKWQKLKFFSFCIEHSCTTLGVKNSEKSLCYSFQDIFNVLFSTKIQDGCQKWQKLKVFSFVWNTLILLCGSKFHSKLLYLLRFTRYIPNVLFSAKIQDGRQKWQKLKFFPFAFNTLVLPCGSIIRSKSLSLMASRYSQIQDGRQKWQKFKFFP